jgi:competence protein ComEA
VPTHRPHRSEPGPASGWTPPKPTRGIAGVRASVEARLPPALRSGILDPGRRGVAALALLALLAVALSGWFFLRARPSAAEATGTAAAASVAATPLPSSSLPSTWSALMTPSSSSAVASTAATTLVVDVVGRVRRPGIVDVPLGSRIDDALVAAGGAIAGTDLAGLDLAAKLVDGEQIFVGVAPPSGPSADAGAVVTGPDLAEAAGGATGASTSARVDLNTADLTELETLPGVGAVLGQRILDWRSAHGPFGAVAQLRQVSGIGPAKYAALSSKVTV